MASNANDLKSLAGKVFATESDLNAYLTKVGVKAGVGRQADPEVVAFVEEFKAGDEFAKFWTATLKDEKAAANKATAVRNYCTKMGYSLSVKLIKDPATVIIVRKAPAVRKPRK